MIDLDRVRRAAGITAADRIFSAFEANASGFIAKFSRVAEDLGARVFVAYATFEMQRHLVGVKSGGLRSDRFVAASEQYATCHDGAWHVCQLRVEMPCLQLNDRWIVECPGRQQGIRRQRLGQRCLAGERFRAVRVRYGQQQASCGQEFQRHGDARVRFGPGFVKTGCYQAFLFVTFA